MSNNTSAELHRFREQWKEEVTARTKGQPTSEDGRPPQPHDPQRRRSVTGEASTARRPPQYTRTVETKEEKDDSEGLDHAWRQNYHDLTEPDEASRLGVEGKGVHTMNTSETPKSALEHYEKAIEREEQGNLGDSVSLYRKAYRLDAGVDKIYKNKYFPPSIVKSKPADPNPSNASITVPNTAHHSLDGPPVSNPSTSQLIASFGGLSICPAPPPTDQSPQPPCPISSLPSEILINIMESTAILDIALFARLSLVCKHFAHLVATEDRIWKQVCLGPDRGFEGMHYNWSCSITGENLLEFVGFIEENYMFSTNSDDSPIISTSNINCVAHSSVSPSPWESLSPTYPTYRSMFRLRPRIRFNGCYISTVNYIRPGASSTAQISWNTPVHIVTYYRYLRFFRDGSCVSLLTTAEPVDVVHHLSKANVPSSAQYGKTNPSLLPPMSIMQHALRGRWKLQSPSLASKEEPEGTLSIETLGIDPDKYTYVMSLAMRSAGRKDGTRNNKLAWRGFWSYNKLTDDWAEFGLKNDKPFFWSRVGSYGAGE